MKTEQNALLTQFVARQIIETVGGQGTPPEYGFQFFTAGLDMYLDTIDEEYLSTYVREGGSAFKMVVGIYGEGKTHFLYSIRELGWKYDYITAYIALNPEQTPFHKLQQVYKSIVANLIYPQTPEELLSGHERGIEAVIKKWYNEKYREVSEKFSEDEVYDELLRYISSLESYESNSFRNAIKEAFKALLEKREGDFSLIIQWLVGENPPKNMLKNYKIFEKLDKSTAFKMIRSLVEWVQEIGYAGLVILLDEAEQTPSMSSKQKNILLNNLRELIDECGHTNFKSTMWFYAVTNENFLEGKTQIYTALTQRLSSIFDEEINPTGAKIYLNRIPIEPIELLMKIGIKLAKTYEVAYKVSFDENVLRETLENIAKEAYKRKLETGYKRLFVKNMIKAFHKLRKSGKPLIPEDIDM
ncbi:MAG: ATP-binding protein [Candidatus Cloacimonetes bacterium]|nr:ATP-binding protein [Candidatus Cloacimonadota bacterium]